MATTSIDFNKVIQWSNTHCFSKSHGKCAGYVKTAFVEGGCKQVSGNGWYNKRFCEYNGFQCVGRLIPSDGNPRAHGGKSIQFPTGYTQQTGDICLIKHGSVGHMCYATGTGINDWVSDYFQKSPGQMDGTGPYCYSCGIQEVQFWRHSSVLNGAPVVSVPSSGDVVADTSTNSIPTYRLPTEPITPQNISSMNNDVNFGNYGILYGMHIKQKK